MPFSSVVNQIQSTVSDKLSAGASAAMGSISSIGGTLSSGASAAASAFSAFSGQAKNLLSAGNLSPAALKGAAAQQVKALDPTSNFKGIPLPAVAATPTAEQPQETMRPDKKGYLRFPLDIGDHFIQFAFSDFIRDNPIAKDKVKDPIFIQLPLSPSLSESYQANYKTQQLGVLGTMADNILKDYLSKGGAPSAEAAGKSLGTSFNAELQRQKDEGAKGAAGALVAQVAQNFAPEVAGAISKSLGATTNPNMAVLFENVSFRSHSFSFKLHPVNQKESEALRSIISAFRSRMLPGKMGQFFLSYPNKCRITINPAQVYPILDCVLESMSVNYAPNGPAFFKGSLGNPVEVDIQLSFKEIVLFTRETADEHDKGVQAAIAKQLKKA